MTEKNTKKQSYTDWAYIDALADDKIDYSDIPPTTEEDMTRASLRMPDSSEVRVPVTLTPDIEVLEWFKIMGKDYQISINNILRMYIKNRKPSSYGQAGHSGVLGR